MSTFEPPRDDWRDEALMADLAAERSAPGAPAAARARVLSAVQAATGSVPPPSPESSLPGGAPGGAEPAASGLKGLTFVGHRLGAWVLAGTVGTAAVFGGRAWMRSEPEPTRPIAAPLAEEIRQPSMSEPQTPRLDVAWPAVVPAAPEQVPPMLEKPEWPIELSVSNEPSAALPSVRARVASRRCDGLPHELEHLLPARKALEQGEPRRALRHLRRYRRACVDGQMIEEAAVLRVQGLVQAGRAGQAARAAQAFQRRFPASPFRSQVEALFRTDDRRDRQSSVKAQQQREE